MKLTTRPTALADTTAVAVAGLSMHTAGQVFYGNRMRIFGPIECYQSLRDDGGFYTFRSGARRRCSRAANASCLSAHDMAPVEPSPFFWRSSPEPALRASHLSFPIADIADV